MVKEGAENKIIIRKSKHKKITKAIVKAERLKDDKYAVSKVVKKEHNHMSIVDIINDRNSGQLAPSEILKKKK